MKNIQFVKIRDLSDYDPALCNNGGKYGFTDEYHREKEGEDFTVQYFTSSDIDYCDIFGNFQECRTCRDFDREEGKCIAEDVTVTEQELAKIIKSIEERKDSDIYIELKEF